MANNLPIVFRNLEARDKSAVAFIVDSWTRSLWQQYQYIPNFKELHHKRISQILMNSHILLVCDSQDSDIILGYVIWEDDVLHWVYVKHHFRKQGLCKELLALVPYTAKFLHSHETKHGRKCIIEKINSRFNPYILEKYSK